MKLAMAVGRNNHYRVGEITGRHFRQTGEAAGLPKTLVDEAISDISQAAQTALTDIEATLPSEFPAFIHDAVKEAVIARLRSL